MSGTDTKITGDEKFPKLSIKVLHVEKCFTCNLHVVLGSVLRYKPLVLWWADRLNSHAFYIEFDLVEKTRVSWYFSDEK